MRLFDRIALYLWRDRYDYDPAVSAPGPDHNVSVWTRWRPARQRLAGLLFNGPLWLGVLAGGFAIAAALLPDYIRMKADQQVKANAGELTLQCVQEGNGILRCRPVGDRQQQLVPGPDGQRRDHERAAKQ